MTRVANCPIEGCTFGESEEKTEAQVRGHMGANADHPNPTEYDGVIPLRQSQPPEETADDQDDQDDQETEDTDTDEMPTDDEYNAQKDGMAQGTEDKKTDSDTSNTSSFDVEKIGLDDDLLLLAAGVIVAGGLAYVIYTGDGSSTQAVETETETDDNSSSETVTASGLAHEVAE